MALQHAVYAPRCAASHFYAAESRPCGATDVATGGPSPYVPSRRRQRHPHAPAHVASDAEWPRRTTYLAS